VSPRARIAQEAILQATLALIAEHGLEGLSVDTIAETTGVSKATLYRYWRSRAELIYAAFEQLQHPTIEPDTGSIRDDLIRLVKQLVGYLNRRDRGAIFTALIDAAARDPELATLHKQNELQGRALFERALGRAIDRGELAADIDIRLFVDLVMSPFIYRRVVVQTPARTIDIEPIVDLVLAAFDRTGAVAD